VPNTPLEKVVGGNMLFYNRATPIEAQLRKELGIGSSGISAETATKKGYDADFLRKAAEDLNRRLYEKH
jgi:hypothetical protein